MPANHEAETPIEPSASQEGSSEELERQRREHLLLDPRSPAVENSLLLDPMYKAGRLFWLSFVLLGGLVVAWGGMWVFQMWNGIGITGLNRPVMWALYIVNFVYYI